MYTMPLYDDLVAGVMKCVAVEVFNHTYRRLHPNLRRTLQQMLFQSGAGPAPPVVPPSPPPQASAAASTSATIALRDVNVSA